MAHRERDRTRENEPPMISKRSNTASAKGRDALCVPVQKVKVMEEVSDNGRVASDRALVSDQAPAGLAPSGFDPSRKARCQSCQRLAEFSPGLPFFEDRGEGSRAATQLCKVCKCYEVAHHPRGDDAPVADRGKIPSIIGEPHQFEPHGPWEFDAFYCGCRGWE